MITLPLNRFKIKTDNNFIEQVLEVCKAREIGRTIKKLQDFLLHTVENVTIAKKSYESFYKFTKQSFYLTVQKLSFEEHNAIKEYFYR